MSVMQSENTGIFLGITCIFLLYTTRCACSKPLVNEQRKCFVYYHSEVFQVSKMLLLKLCISHDLCCI